MFPITTTTGSTAAKAPGPMKVADDRLRAVLGIAEIHSLAGQHSLAVVDSTLAGGTGE